MYDRDLERGATYFYVTSSEKGVKCQVASHDQLYNLKRSSGIVRRAIVRNVQSQLKNTGRFVDGQFPCPSLPNCRLVRLFDFYKKQVDLFPYDETESSFITSQRQYNSFMAESGIISYYYTRTLFITQDVNSNGYYQYFVKRNGEYFVEECDDLIPVDKLTWKPLWGLTLDHPWQIILFKAWLKECGSFQAMKAAQPFSFLEAFGLPEYRVFNFRKQHKFLVNERIEEGQKIQKLNSFTLYDPEINIVARTVPSKSLTQLGLVPNMAGYRIQKAQMEGSTRLFKVYSSLPCYWVGSHSAVLNSPLNQVYNSKLALDLQRTILMTEKQVLTYFNKFYAAPSIISDPKKLFIQDCINAKVKNSSPVWIKFSAIQAGMLALCIQVPKIKENNVYPQFRYFLSKRNDQQQMSRSHFREDIAGSKLQQNMYISSNCDKWEYYRIDYIQGYQNHSAIFTKVTPGDYVLYIQAEMTGNLRVRFDCHVRLQQPIIFQPSASQAKQIFDSTFFSISRDSAVEATFNQATFEESITLNNSFEQLGYGSICIKTLAKAKHKVAMRVYPEKLKAAGLQLLSHYSDFQQDENKQKNLVLISSKGKPEIVVLQRITNRSKSQIGEVFPPEGTVQFFKVVPLTKSLPGNSALPQPSVVR